MQTRIRQNRNRLLVERSKPDIRDTKYIHARQENSQKTSKDQKPEFRIAEVQARARWNQNRKQRVS